MFKIRFWPITASPITAISALGSMLCIVTGAENNARLPVSRQRFLGVYQALDVELEEEHVAIPHDVIAAFDTVMARLSRAAHGAFFDKVFPVDGLGLDEPALEIGVDSAGGFHRDCACGDRPGADFPVDGLGLDEPALEIGVDSAGG